MLILKRYSRWFEGGIWLVLIVLAGIYTFDFDDALPTYLWGPAHWPRVVLLGMLAASLWLLFVESRHSDAKVESQPIDHHRSPLAVSTRVRMVLIFCLPLAYAFAIHKMGFLLITPLFLFAYMWVVGVRKIRTLIIMTVCIYSGIVIIFVELIFTYLPPGAGVFHTINGYILKLLQ